MEATDLNHGGSGVVVTNLTGPDLGPLGPVRDRTKHNSGLAPAASVNTNLSWNFKKVATCTGKYLFSGKPKIIGAL